MNLNSRLESLGKRHKDLDALIARELQHPASSDLQLADLKRRKLAIKDQMTELEAQMKQA